MSKENEVKTEEKAMKEKELENAPKKNDGELDPSEMKEVAGGRRRRN